MNDRLCRISTSVVTSVLATLLLLVATPRFAAATVIGDYLAIPSTTTYTPIAGGTTALAGTNLNITARYRDAATTGTLPIGFTFIFDGVAYTSLSANTSGLILLGNATSGSFANDLAAAPAYPAIAPLWDHQHLYNNGGGACTFNPQIGVSYILSGSAPNREFVIEWNTQVADTGNTFWWAGCGVTMNRLQARLHEGTNLIEFVYGTVWASAGQLTAASIGLAQSATDFLSATPSGGTSLTTSGAMSNNGIRFDQTPIAPATVYRFFFCPLKISGDPAQGGTSAMNNGDTLLSTVSVVVPGTTTLSPMTLSHPNSICGALNYTLAIGGASAAEYAFQATTNQALAGTLNTGETLTPPIVFTPAAAGVRSASLVVTDTTSGLVLTYPLAGLGQSTTTTALVSNTNPAYPTQAVTFTATVTGANPGSLVPTGNITFKEGTNVLAVVPLDGMAQAALTMSTLPEGTYSITAEYAGDTYFVASTSAIVTQVIQKVVATVSVMSSLNPSFVGQTVTLSASVAVAGGAPTPTGSVRFMDGPDLLEVVALNGSAQAVHVNTTFISANHAIRVEYTGDAFTAAGTSPVLSQLVYRNAVTVAGTSAPNPSVVGQAVTITAAVAGGAGTPVATGSVTFSADTGPLGIVILDGTGQAVLVTAVLPAGARTITVSYPGNIVFPNASTNIAHSVEKNPSEVAIVSSNNPSLTGQPVTFTATVRGSAVGAPPGTGSVTFKEGATVLSTGVLDANGQATFTTSSLTAGAHIVTVDYAGDGYYMAGTSMPVTQTVNLSGASVSLASSDNPSSYEQSVTFTATATGSAQMPTGVMTFRDGTTLLGTANLSGSGVAAYSTAALTTGAHTVTAVYGGDSVYSAGATGTVTQVIDRASTMTGLAASTASTTSGTSVTWTATVTSTAAGTIGGTVTFNEGLTVIGTGTLGSNGTTTTSFVLAVGAHDVTATFGGDTNFAPSTSSSVRTTVTQPEAGVDAGPDASRDAVAEATPPPIDGTPLDMGRPDAGPPDISSHDSQADVTTMDTAMPPVSDVRLDLAVPVPDVQPPVPDAGPDTADGRVAAPDVRADAPRTADGSVVTPPSDETGCGCRVGQRSSSRAGFAMAGALVAVTLLRARRRRVEGTRNDRTR
ncbi:MAG TPA: Ig-like domain-containing protein [Polyangiaceae bacterium]|nr:Ig-like domain-containing protein [Polyangiaceae bacterium]